ncbi:MAG TPA: AzlD domain-containing protein [Thermomicrobiales bacterium]|jgi:branched-subunit amino acid transport protein
MGTIGLILAAALATYGTRIAGFTLAQRQLPGLFGRLLTYIPVAVFAALIAPDLGLGTSEAPARLLGVAAAALAVWRTRQLWAGLAAGMLIFWLARAFG